MHLDREIKASRDLCAAILFAQFNVIDIAVFSAMDQVAMLR